jgi:hypothetical protein
MHCPSHAQDARQLLEQARLRNAHPVEAITQAIRDLSSGRHLGVSSGSGPAADPFALGSHKRGSTPLSTGLKGGALRVPAVGGAIDAHPSTAGAARPSAAPLPASKFKGVLKKLTFSDAKSTAGPSTAPHTLRTGVGGSAWAASAMPPPPPRPHYTTTKQLRFDIAATPAGTQDARSGIKRVTFAPGSHTPASGRPRELGSVSQAMGAQRA